MRRRIAAIGMLGAWLGFAASAHAIATTSVEFIPLISADAVNLSYDGFSVLNTSTTKSVLVTAPIGMKTIRGIESLTVEIYIDNGTDGRTTTCSVFGHSTLTPTEHSGSANTNLHGKQTISVQVTANTGSSGDPTFFVVQCNLPRGGTHKVFGSISFPDVVR